MAAAALVAAAATPCAGPRAGPWRGRTGVPAFSTISSSKSGRGARGSGHTDLAKGVMDLASGLADLASLTAEDVPRQSPPVDGLGGPWAWQAYPQAFYFFIFLFD